MTFIAKPADGDWPNGAHINHSFTSRDDPGSNLFSGEGGGALDAYSSGEGEAHQGGNPSPSELPFEGGWGEAVYPAVGGLLEHGAVADRGGVLDRPAYDLTAAEMKVLGARRLPTNLLEAIQEFELDPLAREVFGETMHTLYARYKHGEWRRFHEHVTEWERTEYLRFF